MNFVVLLATALIGLGLPDTPAPKPLLAVDTPLVSLQVRRCVLWCAPTTVLGRFSERVFDKNRAGALDGITVRVETITKAGGGFNPKESVSFSVDNEAVDLWAGQDSPKLRVGPMKQLNIDGAVHDLAAGEYNATLRFVSPSSENNDAEKVTLSIFVKDDFWIPLVVILLGVAVSFLTKKIFVAVKDRVTLLFRISQLDASWLRNEPLSAAIVWTQANLRLAKMWTRNVQLSVPDMITARLADIEGLVPTLTAIRDMRALLEVSVGDPLALARSLGKLQVLTSRCSNPPLTAATKNQITDELKKMEAWASSDQLPAALWNDRLGSIKQLASIDLTGIKNASAAQVAQPLLAALTTAINANATPSNVFGIYEKYAALEVFWQHRGEADLLGTMATEYGQTGSVRKLFQIADDDAWKKLKATKNCEIAGPTVAPRAFEPFTLRVRTSDPDVNESYLFKYKLRYRWNIQIESDAGKGGKARTRVLTPETLEPEVTQFAPHAGRVQATVTICYGACDSRNVDAATLTVESSAEVPLVTAMQRAEVGPLLIAAAIALLTGLSTQYFGNQTFGSPKDYVMLFFTGVAVDWAKNAVQPSPTSPPAQK